MSLKETWLDSSSANEDDLNPNNGSALLPNVQADENQPTTPLLTDHVIQMSLAITKCDPMHVDPSTPLMKDPATPLMNEPATPLPKCFAPSTLLWTDVVNPLLKCYALQFRLNCLYVSNLDNFKKVTIMFCNHDTVFWLKKQIQQKMGIPALAQEVRLFKTVLQEDRMRLRFFGVKHMAELHVCDKRTIQLLVDTVNKNTLAITVPLSLQVEVLKTRICMLCNVPVKDTWLSYGTRAMMSAYVVGGYVSESGVTIMHRYQDYGARPGGGGLCDGADACTHVEGRAGYRARQ